MGGSITMACSGRGDSILFMIFPATSLAWVRAAPLKPSVGLPILMVMTEADELFGQAYGLDVVDERPREAIDLCRKVLEIDPDHYRARVFLGMLLDDHGDQAEKLESGQHFVEAIKRAKSVSLLCDSGYEESALHHLGIWERDRGHAQNASLFFLANALLCKSDESYEYLVEWLDPSMIDVASAIKPLLLSQVKSEESLKRDGPNEFRQPNNGLQRTRR